MPTVKKINFFDDEFLASLSHDMKNPIKAQIRAIDLLLSGSFGEFSNEAKNLLLNIQASNKYLQSIVDNVLSQYRINKGSVFLDIKSHDFRKTLEDVLDSIGILADVKAQKIEINYAFNNFIYDYDEISIKRVLINLLTNAIFYSKENSTIKILIENLKSSIKFSVKSKSSHAKISHGEGLGFAICNKILDFHKGKFEAENLGEEFVSSFLLYS